MVAISKPLAELGRLVVAFRDERDWAKFHTPKDLAISLMLEAAELLETTQWKSDEQIRDLWKQKPELVGDELADILYWLVLIAEEAGVDLEAHFMRKLTVNAKKYPADVVRGRSDKYTTYLKGDTD